MIPKRPMGGGKGYWTQGIQDFGRDCHTAFVSASYFIVCPCLQPSIFLVLKHYSCFCRPQGKSCDYAQISEIFLKLFPVQWREKSEDGNQQTGLVFAECSFHVQKGSGWVIFGFLNVSSFSWVKSWHIGMAGVEEMLFKLKKPNQLLDQGNSFILLQMWKKKG